MPTTITAAQYTGHDVAHRPPSRSRRVGSAAVIEGPGPGGSQVRAGDQHAAVGALAGVDAEFVGALRSAAEGGARVTIGPSVPSRDATLRAMAVPHDARGLELVTLEDVAEADALVARRIEELGASLERAITVAIVGGTHGLREGVAQAVARACGRPLVQVDLDRCKPYLEEPGELIRELRLARALPFVINVASAQEDPALRNQLLALGGALARLPYPVLVGGNDRRALSLLLGQDRPSVTVQVARSTLDERNAAWGAALEQRGWNPALSADSVVCTSNGIARAD